MRDLLLGPAPAGPVWLRRLAERWARLPPRLRLVAQALVVVALFSGLGVHAAATQARWGGTGMTVWRATATIPAGQPPGGRLVQMTAPSAVVPIGAVADPDPGQVLAVPLIQGAILTETHLVVAGPAVALAEGDRLLPVPVEPGWGVEAGAIVDVWALADRDGAARALASGRPVLSVTDDRGQHTALLSLPGSQVQAATEAFVAGRLILTLAPG